MNQRHTNTNYQPMKMCYYYDNTNKIDNSSFIRNNTNPYNPITNLQHYNQNQQQLRSFNRTNNNNNNNNTSFNNNISNNNCKQQPSVRFVSISNNTNTKIMQSQPIYEGVEPIMFNNNNKTLNSNLSFGDFNGTGIYSNVTDVDPSFFTPNEYDNAQKSKPEPSLKSKDSKNSVQSKTTEKTYVPALIAPLDYSFMQLETFSDLKGVEPRVYKGSDKLVKSGSKYVSYGIKLNNNSLEDIEDLMGISQVLFYDGLMLTWIDLSCNKLPNISRILTYFKKLKILNLHGNKISDLSEIEKLKELPDLLKLTLHGNPIELEKNYFYYVLARLPNLINFDFTGISPGDRLTAKTFQDMIFKNRNRRGAKNKAR